MRFQYLGELRPIRMTGRCPIKATYTLLENDGRQELKIEFNGETSDSTSTLTATFTLEETDEYEEATITFKVTSAGSYKTLG